MKFPLQLVGAFVLGIVVALLGVRSRSADGSADDGSDSPSGGRPSASRSGQRHDTAPESLLSSLLKGKSPSDLTTEEALGILSAVMDKPAGGDSVEQAKMDYQFQLLMAKLPLPVVEEMLTAAREKGVLVDKVHRLFAAYARRDPDKAMAWANGQTDGPRLRAIVIRGLSQEDPGQAALIYQKELLASTTRKSDWEAGESIARSYARHGHAALLDYLDTLPSGFASSFLPTAIQELPEGDVAAFLGELEKRTAAKNWQGWHMTELLGRLSVSHPLETARFLERMEPGKDRANTRYSLAMALMGQGKGEESREMLGKVMADLPGGEKQFVMMNLQGCLRSFPEMAVAMVEALPEEQGLTAEDLQRWPSFNFGHPDGMMNLAQLIRSRDGQASYLVESFNKIGPGNNNHMDANDFKLLADRLETLELPADGKARAQEALEEARVRATAK
ncbi:MAG: hypothetical protein EOP88_12090 [Verrucomicrobiaceae bacterium]|nr:MAG: hypothetical protein EOP88_12090 [Verrucomicrobiaceae bacterium]